MSENTALLNNDPGIQVTQPAKAYIARQLERGKAMGLRISVRQAGCSGYEYVLSLAEAPAQFDFVFAHEDPKISVIVDKETYLKYLKGGTIIDFKKEGLNEGLKILNPNVSNECGCGESVNFNG